MAKRDDRRVGKKRPQSGKAMFTGPFAETEDADRVSNQGERYVPLVDPYCGAMHLGHMASYRLALRHAYGKTVLDLGCGAGYGAHFLAHFGAREVIAGDLEKAALAYAAENYHQPNVAYIRVDGNRTLPFSGQTFDFVFSSQAIEHVEDTLHFLKEIGRVLKPGGFCLITTPNRALFSPDACRSANRHHLNEMDVSEYEALGRRVFPKVELAGIPQNCLVRHEDKTVTVKSDAELIPGDYQACPHDIAHCENLLLYGHTETDGEFEVTLPEACAGISRRTDPMFWDKAVGRWVIMGRYPKAPPAGRLETKTSYGSARAVLSSPFSHLYRIDVGLAEAGRHEIDVELRLGPAPGGPAVLRAVAALARRKLSIIFPPVEAAAGQTYILNLRARCGIATRLLNRKNLPRFDFRNGELPVWTFHQPPGDCPDGALVSREPIT